MYLNISLIRYSTTQDHFVNQTALFFLASALSDDLSLLFRRRSYPLDDSLEVLPRLYERYRQRGALRRLRRSGLRRRSLERGRLRFADLRRLSSRSRRRRSPTGSRASRRSSGLPASRSEDFGRSSSLAGSLFENRLILGLVGSFSNFFS